MKVNVREDPAPLPAVVVRLSIGILGLALAACAQSGVAVSSTESTTTTARPTTTQPPSTTAGPSTTSARSSTTAPHVPSIEPEVIVPEGEGPFPAVVLVHGGGWVAGDPSIMRPLARALSNEGFLTVNTNYTLAGEQTGFPAAIDDVACAVRFAQTHPDSDGSVVILGHSAGAHIAALVALTGDQYGAGCPYEGSGLPDRLVGLAGPYDIDRLGFVMIPFFGAGPETLPDAWAAGNPLNHVGDNTKLATLLLHGDADGIVDISFSYEFETALRDAGSDVLMEVVEGANHEMLRQASVVGDLIVTWLLR